MNSLHAIIAVWLNASQRGKISIGMNRSVGVTGKSHTLSGPRDWMLHYMRTTFTDAFVCRSSGARQRYGLDAALYENYLYWPLSAGLEMLHYMRTTFTDAFVCRSSGARQRYGLDAALYENYLY